MFVLSGQLGLHEQIHRSPDRIEQTGECEIEEPQPEVFRRCHRHESLDRPVAALDLSPIPVLSEKSAPSVGDKHRVLSVIIMLSVLLTAVDQRRCMPLVVPEMEFPVSLIAALVASKQPFGLVVSLLFKRTSNGQHRLVDILHDARRNASHHESVEPRSTMCTKNHEVYALTGRILDDLTLWFSLTNNRNKIDIRLRSVGSSFLEH